MGSIQCILHVLGWGLFSNDHSKHCFLDFSQCRESWEVFFLCLRRTMSVLLCHPASEPSLFSENPLHLLFSPKSPFLLVQQLSSGGSGRSHLQAQAAATVWAGNSKSCPRLCAHVAAQCSCNTLNQASDGIFLLATCTRSNHAYDFSLRLNAAPLIYSRDHHIITT